MRLIIRASMPNHKGEGDFVRRPQDLLLIRQEEADLLKFVDYFSLLQMNFDDPKEPLKISKLFSSFPFTK